MSELRLGDIVDDYCSRCRIISNHSIVAMVEGEPAKVQCRSCYNEHKYRHGKTPKKKASKKAALFDEVLSKMPGHQGDE